MKKSNITEEEALHYALIAPMAMSALSLVSWTRSKAFTTDHLLFMFTRLPRFRKLIKDKDEANEPIWLYTLDVYTREAVNQLSDSVPNGATLAVGNDLIEFVKNYKANAKDYGEGGKAFLEALANTHCNAIDILTKHCPFTLNELAEMVDDWETENKITIFGFGRRELKNLRSALFKFVYGRGLRDQDLELMSGMSGEMQIVLSYFRSVYYSFKAEILEGLTEGFVPQATNLCPTPISLPFGGLTLRITEKFIRNLYTTEVYGDDLVSRSINSYGFKKNAYILETYKNNEEDFKLVFKYLTNLDCLSYVDNIGILLHTTNSKFNNLFSNDVSNELVKMKLLSMNHTNNTSIAEERLLAHVKSNGSLARFQLRLIFNALKANEMDESVIMRMLSFSGLSQEEFNKTADALLHGTIPWTLLDTNKRIRFTEACDMIFKTCFSSMNLKDTDLGADMETPYAHMNVENSVMIEPKTVTGRKSSKTELTKGLLGSAGLHDEDTDAEESDYEDEPDGIQVPFGNFITKECLKQCNKMYVKHEKDIEDSILEVFGRNRKDILLIIGEEGCGMSTHVSHLIAKQYLNGNLKLNGKDLAICPLPTITAQPGLPANYVYQSMKKIVEEFKKSINSFSDKGKTELLPVCIYEDLSALVNISPMGSESHIEDVCRALKQHNAKLVFTCNKSKLAKFGKDEQRFIRKNMEVLELSAYEDEEVLKALDFNITELESHYFFSAPIGLKELALQYAKEYYKGQPLIEASSDLILKAFSKASLHSSGLCKQATSRKYKVEFSIEALHTVVRTENGIKPGEIDKNPYEAVKELGDSLRSEVFGQEEAVSQFLKQWKIAKSGLREANKPQCTMMFIGQTGVGKTELAKQIADFTNKKLIRIDMSEYAQSFTTSSLIGSASGYVGYNDGGILTNAVKSNPDCVLLLDEIEKAHRDVHNLLLQVMDNAELTSNNGTKVDFQKTIIIMTSNCGATELTEQKSLGFNSRPVSIDDAKDLYSQALKDKFTPEFLGRINSVVQFKPLNDDISRKIILHKWDSLVQSISEKYANITEIRMDKSLTQHYLEKITSNQSGARGIFNQMSNDILEPLCDALLMYGVRKELSASKAYPYYKFKVSCKTDGGISVTKALVEQQVG